jgi:predicted branched-subunit amino acid permease
MWVVALERLPEVPRERRVAFCNGIGAGFLAVATLSSAAGFYLAANLPPLLAGALLFLTPISFLVSVYGSTRRAVDRLALLLGLVFGPVLALRGVELDLLWAGIAGGTLAFVIGRLRRRK